MRFSYDLHVHSCLSPCGDADMTPNNIVHLASLLGIDILALTDHNSCGNCAAATAVGEKAGVLVVPGMELCTAAHCPGVQTAGGYGQHAHRLSGG